MTDADLMEGGGNPLIKFDDSEEEEDVKNFGFGSLSSSAEKAAKATQVEVCIEQAHYQQLATPQSAQSAMRHRSSAQQPDYRTAPMHTHTAPMHTATAPMHTATAPMHTATAPMHTATDRNDVGANAIMRTISVVNERYELAKIKFANACSPRMERCYRRLQDLRRFFCCCSLLCVVAVLSVVWLTHDEAAYVEDVMRPTYARHGINGVNLSIPSNSLQCSDIQTGILRPLQDGRRDDLSLLRVRAAAEYLITEDALPCVCGPMLGSPRQYTAVSLDTTIMHLHNPTIDRTWTGRIDDKTTLDATARSIVNEHQRMLFPTRVETVDVIRYNTVRMAYQTAECRTASLVLRDEHAWCVQACDDLFAGKSVYDVSVN